MEKGTSRREGEHGATATGRGNLDISAKHGELERLGGFIGVADNGWSSWGWETFLNNITRNYRRASIQRRSEIPGLHQRTGVKSFYRR